MFNVYELLDIEPVKAKGIYLWDKDGNKYMDFYGGHAVISIGHTHPIYVNRITEQLNKIGFYSNSVINSLQEELEDKLKKNSSCMNYRLFLCNSGAEANENALKLASFTMGRDKILAFKSAFHGRTSAAVAVTDNKTIQAPLNTGHLVSFINLNDMEALERELSTGTYAAVIVEGIQGVGGIQVSESDFLQSMRKLCDNTGTIMILDEIQSGFGRSGKFFSYQYANIEPDIVTMAKGMGNGFPVGGLLIKDTIIPKKGMLGTTFGGNHLACVACLAVLEVFEKEKLIENAAKQGEYLSNKLKEIKGISDIRGRGLMIGVDAEEGQDVIRKRLLDNSKILIGNSGKHTLRLLPPLNVLQGEIDYFVEQFTQTINV